MELRNNNKEILRELSKAGYKNSKSRNRVLIGAAALAVAVIFSIFSIAVGRVDAEYLAYARSSGTVASTLLEDATMEQYEQINDLDYIDTVGREQVFGSGLWDGESIFACSVVDDVAYSQMYLPAYTDVEGEYPQAAYEIMLPMRALEQMGIEEPKLKMEIPLEIYMDQHKSDQRTFILSGYYTEYVDPLEAAPRGYFSEAYLNEVGDSLDETVTLLMMQSDSLSGEYVEEKLYNDIETVDDIQQFFGGNPLSYEMVEELTGGYDIAVLCVLIVLLCVYLLVNNVMSISLNRDIRHYGMLKTLGTTSVQLRKIIYRHALHVALVGIPIGALAGCAIVLGLIPGMLSGYYLHNYGPAASMMGFRPLLLLVAMGFTFIVLFISIFQPVRRMSRISPIEAVKYMGREVPVKKRERSSSSENGNKLYKMAWRDIFRNRKDTWMTIASIALGLIMALCSVVIVTGTDYRNSIMQEPDFSISTWDSPYDNDEYTESSYPINQAFLESVQAIDGVESFNIGYGGYVNLNTSEAAWMPLLRGTKIADGLQDTEDEKEYAEAVRNNYVAGYTIVDEVYIDELEEYILKNGLNVDMESFRSGTGVIALHHNKLSEQLTIAGQEVIGESITISNLHEESAGEMNFCGYLNMNAKGFPSLLCGVNTSSRPYLIMSRAAYESLDLTETILRLNIEVVSILEPSIKVQLNELIELQNERITDVNRETAIYSSAKSDTLEDAESYLTIIRIIMYGISSLLILLGLLNYFNVTAMKLISRNKEFAVMESIGMTRRQIRKLLVYEGMYYSGIISIIVLTIGSAAMYGVGVALKSRLAYAKFVYPHMELTVIMVVLFAVCSAIPLIMYRAKTESVINSLRRNIE